MHNTPTQSAPDPGAPMSLARLRLCNTPTGEKPSPTSAFDFVQVLPDRTILWHTSRVNKRARTEEQKASLAKGTAGQYNGQMSKATKSKCNKLLMNWMQTIQYHIDKYKRNRKRAKYWPVMVTLTLSDKQTHTDQWIKRHYLNTFIQTIKRRYFVENYFWRAEAQENGNIHFHVIIDKYIPAKELTSMWNEIQSEYVTAYTKRTGKSDPPSTQIEGIRNYKRISLYATKYALKDDTSDTPVRKIEGRIWGCSDQLRCIQSYKRSKLDEERATIEAEIRRIDFMPLEKYVVEQAYFWVKLSPQAWDRLDILHASMQDHYRQQYMKLYIDHEFDDVKRTLQLIDAQKDLTRKALEFSKAVENGHNRPRKIKKAVPQLGGYAEFIRQASKREFAIRSKLVGKV